MKPTDLLKPLPLLLFILLLLCGCASNLGQSDLKKPNTDASEGGGTPPPVPPELQFPPLLKVEPEKEKLFSFSGREVALKDILHPLSKEGGFNIIWDKEVDPETQITVNFEDLTLKEALELIFSSTDYLYSLNSPTLNVKLIDTRVFELGQVPTKVKSQILVGGDVLGSIPNLGRMRGQFQITGSSDDEAVDLWKQVEEGLKSIISPQGRYFINRIAGIITLTDRKESLKLAEEYFEKLKNSLNRQVLIEVEVVEVTLERTRSWGVDWQAVHSFLVDNKIIDVTATQTLGLPGSIVEFTASRHDATFIVDLLGKFGEVNVLSKPRVSVTNGQTALINAGRVVSYWELTGISGGAQIGQPAIFPEQKTALLGLTMGVTPYISSEDHVTMQVVPIVSDASTWAEFQFQNQTLKAPNIDIRETSTQVRIKNGETVVIGGLITSKRSDIEHKIPVLGDLPLLGYLFKRKEKTEQRAELVIFLTPRITSFEKREG